MATILFDLTVTIDSPATTKAFNQEDKQQLFKRPKVEKVKPKKAGSVPRTEIEGPESSKVLELGELSEGYGELIIRATNLLESLRGRLAPLVYNFDPEQAVELAEAAGRIFQGATNQITYDMYLAALRLDKDVSVEIGESESGFIRQINQSTN